MTNVEVVIDGSSIFTNLFRFPSGLGVPSMLRPRSLLIGSLAGGDLIGCDDDERVEAATGLDGREALSS